MSIDPHQRALDLQRNANNAELAAQDPDLAYPWLEPHEYPDPRPRIAEAEDLLRRHLLDHRNVLGDHPDWKLHYDFIDNPPPPPPLESRWAPEQLMIGRSYDDPPF
ncbi:hypothetical protein [Nocardia cyriacigeorgica]|uniref:hypothetical protein n=1 Tax=Nocardia cyriacigeorgica TaxID=135487 RepID=UPI0034DB4B86